LKVSFFWQNNDRWYRNTDWSCFVEKKDCVLFLLCSSHWNWVSCSSQKVSFWEGQTRCGTFRETQLAIIDDQLSLDSVLGLAGKSSD
jgi:hypothetical protein